MSEPNFKGKEFAYNHHLSVPHRPLMLDADKSIGPVWLDGNLIVQGDNTQAEALFRAEVAAERIQFRLRTDGHSWRMPFEAETFEPAGAP